MAREPLIESLAGASSGLSLALLFWAFERASPEAVSNVVARAERDFTFHYTEISSEIINIVFFVMALTFAISGPWAIPIRKFSVKPALKFLQHSFSIGQGVVAVILIKELVKAPVNWWYLLCQFGFISVFFSASAFFCGVGSYYCDHGLKGLC